MTKDKQQKNRHVYWNPYFGGFLLGIIILFTFYMTGRGLGASGAMKSSVVSIVETVAPTHAGNNAYYPCHYFSPDIPLSAVFLNAFFFRKGKPVMGFSVTA